MASPTPPTKPPAKFVQIVTSGECLYALDETGQVWRVHLSEVTTGTWVRCANKRLVD